MRHPAILNVFAEGVQLEGHISSSGHLKNAHGSIVEYEAIGIVVSNHDVVAASELHCFLEHGAESGCAGGHMGIVEPHQFHAFQRCLLESVEIGHPSALFGEVVVEYLGLCESAYRSIVG